MWNSSTCEALQFWPLVFHFMALGSCSFGWKCCQLLPFVEQPAITEVHLIVVMVWELQNSGALAVILFAHSALNWWWLGAVLLLGASWRVLGSWSGFSLCHNQPLWALLWMVSGLTPVVTIVMWWSWIDLNYCFYIWLPLTYVCCALPVILALCSGVNQSQSRWGLVGSQPCSPWLFLCSPGVFVLCSGHSQLPHHWAPAVYVQFRLV